MDIKSYHEAADFLAAAGSLVRTDEVRYGLIYGIAQRVAANPHHYGEEDPWFCILADRTGISTLAWRTPPYPVGLAWHAGDKEAAASALVKCVRNRWQEIPGVTGHREVTDLFAEKWSKALRVTVRSTQSQRIYRLDSVSDVRRTSGRLRLATLEDRDLILDWTRAFAVDTQQGREGEISERLAAQRIENGEIYLWEDAGQPVSMAAKSRPTDHGMAIGLVYTPPELRRKGYATACVAAVCTEILRSGYDFCTLYTDLANPTSNSIYMKIGFRPVCDSVQYTFSDPVK
jgi:predicted GNAT family acetyltransferase